MGDLQAHEHGPSGSAACSNSGNDGALKPAATAAPPRASAPGATVLRKHLVFSDPQLERSYRLHAAHQSTEGEVWATALQACSWLMTAQAAWSAGTTDAALRMLLWCLLPSLAHLYLVCRPCAWYQRHRDAVSTLLRVARESFHFHAMGMMALGTQEDVRSPVPSHLRLLVLAAGSLAAPPLLHSLTFVWSYAYNTLQLALWVMGLRRSQWFHAAAATATAAGISGGSGGGGAPGLGLLGGHVWQLLCVGALLAAYLVPLILLYQAEVTKRHRFLQQTGAQRAIADRQAVLEFLLPAAIMVWSVCMQDPRPAQPV